MRKIMFILSVLFLAISIVAFVGCKNGDGKEHEHVYGESITVTPATFEKDGEGKRVCSACGYEYFFVIPERTEKTYSITYDLNGGTVSDNAMKGVPGQYKNTDEDVEIVLRPYKRKYVFKGWSVGGETPVKNYVIKSGTDGNVVLTAVYEKDATTYYDGGEVDILPDAVAGYLYANNKADYLYKYDRNYAIGDDVKGVKISWSKTGTSVYKLSVASDEEAKNEIYSYSGSSLSVTLYNLVPDKTYYYTVKDNYGNLIKNDSFKLASNVRAISCGNVTNMRDMGGRETPDGTVKYEMVYRSPEIANANGKATDVIVNELGIKTEIDLRFESTTDTISDKITKYTLGIVQWDYLFPGMNENRPSQSTAIANLAEIFRIFADKDNYPILFHCSAGADRTGTIAFLLNGLLGVSYEDLAEDFEITSFYFGKRWRSDIVENNGKYSFDESGVMQDNPDNLVAFDKTYRYLLDTYGTDGGTLSGAIENYLKTVAGLTDYEIYSVKHLMLGTAEHKYGEWQTVKKGSCRENGEKRRYCACGEYESEVIETIGTHIYGDWETVTQPTLDHDGLRKRTCDCGEEQTERLPKLTKTVYDFNGIDLNNTVGVDALNKHASTASSEGNIPQGFSGGVYGRTDTYLVAIGVGFSKDYKLEEIVELKVRIAVVSDEKLSKGNFRIYNDTENDIKADKNYEDLSGGVYGEWVEIDLLPILKEAATKAGSGIVDENGVLQKFEIIVRTGVTATVYFDSITVIS